ncbi:MAG: hypothetical protein ABIS17_12675 [Casimicrobiaceae bacterium]
MKRYDTPSMFSTFGGIAAALASVATLATMVVLPASYTTSAGRGTLAKRPAVQEMASAPRVDLSGHSLDCSDGTTAEQS